MNESSQAERMSRAARELEDQIDPQATMQSAVQLAADYVPACDAAAITIVQRRGRLRSPAYTDDLARSGDQLQYEVGEGPCVDAVWEQSFVHSPDLLKEDRWMAWAPRVANELGARAMMCFRLFTASNTLGALNLYSRSPHAFDTHDRDEGVALASHVAIAVSAAQASAHLNSAIDSRTTIGQATGMLMERHKLTADRAFSVLARISSQREVKISVVAQQLVTTRELPQGGDLEL